MTHCFWARNGGTHCGTHQNPIYREIRNYCLWLFPDGSSLGQEFLGSGFGRTDFSRIFIFGSPDFFADFLAGFFLLIFVGESAQKNPPGKSPQKSSKIYTTKILRHISAEWPGQEFLGYFLVVSLVFQVLVRDKYLLNSSRGLVRVPPLPSPGKGALTGRGLLPKNKRPWIYFQGSRRNFR